MLRSPDTESTKQVDVASPEAACVGRELHPSTRLALQAEIGRILSESVELQGTLQACAAALVRNTHVALARIWIVQSGVLKLQASAGLLIHDDDIRAIVPVGQFSISHIARTRTPVLTNSLLEHPHIHEKEWARREGMVAFAGFPLLSDDHLVGAIAIFDDKPITNKTSDAISAIAAELALAIRSYSLEPGCAPGNGASAAVPGFEHAIVFTSPDDMVRFWSSGAERLFGYAAAEMVGQPLDRVVPIEHREEHREMMRRAHAGQSATRSEAIRLHKSGRTLDTRITTSPWRDAFGAVIGGVTIVHDLTEFKRLQREYLLSQKMEVFGRLAGGVAHDFNNLLTVILGYSEIAIRRMPGHDPLRELLCEIHKAGEKASSLTRQLLAFSRNKAVEPKILDLNAVVSDTEKMLRRLIGEDILMTTIFATKLKPIKVDPGQMQQVILNLAVNARDAMPQGGRLTIETSNAVLDEAYARRHPTVVPGNYVLLAITDTGVGMSPAVQTHIFEPLFTTKGPGKGTGLGLATVHTIVTQHGGHIDVESQLGRGTSFKIYLPQADAACSRQASDVNLRTIPRGKETIFLVEDEDSVRALARQVLELNGYTVLEAINGDEAISLASQHGGPIHLLLGDVVLPNRGGRALADHMLCMIPNLRILFLSGYTSDAVARHGIADTEFAFLQKPFGAAALAQKVREALDHPPKAA